MRLCCPPWAFARTKPSPAHYELLIISVSAKLHRRGHWNILQRFRLHWILYWVKHLVNKLLESKSDVDLNIISLLWAYLYDVCWQKKRWIELAMCYTYIFIRIYVWIILQKILLFSLINTIWVIVQLIEIDLHYMQTY